MAGKSSHVTLEMVQQCCGRDVLQCYNGDGAAMLS